MKKKIKFDLGRGNPKNQRNFIPVHVHVHVKHVYLALTP